MTTKKSQETAQKILDAAFKCISTHGCNRVTLREIAEEAGVALSQLNYYFTNKEKLFSEVLKSMRKEYVSDLEANMANRPNIQEKISFLINFNKRLLVENKELYTAFLEFFNMAMWSDSFRGEINQFLKDITEAIEKHIHSVDPGGGLQPRPDPAVLTRMILGTSFGIAMQVLVNPQKEDLLECFDVLRMTVGWQAQTAQSGQGPHR